MSDSYLGENLIFVISQPRCGSTLVQRILSGHQDIESSAETWLMLLPVYASRENGLEAEYGHRWYLVARNDFLDHYTDGREVYDEAVREWARVFYDNALKHSGGKIFIDKTPRYSLIIPELKRLFPKARFVFLLRNPLAVFSSVMTSFVKGRPNVIPEFKTDLYDAPERILEGIELFGNEAVVVRYEELVKEPEAIVMNLCRQLGIEFNSEMLDYSRTPEAKGFMTDRVGVNQRDQVTDESLNKWKSALDDPQLASWMSDYLGELGQDIVTRMGYNYDEMQAEVKAEAKPGKNLLPWRIAKHPMDEMNLRQLYGYSRWQQRQKTNAVSAEIITFGLFLRESARRLRDAFSA